MNVYLESLANIIRYLDKKKFQKANIIVVVVFAINFDEFWRILIFLNILLFF